MESYLAQCVDSGYAEFLLNNKIANIGEIFLHSPSPKLVEFITSIMTPQHIIDQAEFERPSVITPELFASFDDLLLYREEIRNLQLVPIKNQEQYDYYHSQPKESLTQMVLDYVKNVPFAFEPNMFPYNLPQDTEQYIVWIKERETKREEIAEFVAHVVAAYGLDPNRIILFERPIKSSLQLVRGTVKEVRHIHFWLKGQQIFV